MVQSRGTRRALESGFSLIELVVVVAIVGVLAAVAVPLWTGAQGRAQDASAEADLMNDKAAIVSFAAERGGRPSAIDGRGQASWAGAPVDLTRYGWSRGPSTAHLDYQPAAGESWCLLATSSSGAVLRVTSSSAVTRSTSCPTVL